MTIARQSLKGQKKVKEAKLVDLSGKKVYMPTDNREKHFNFRKREKGNMNGGLYFKE